MSDLKIAIILGSTRPGRNGKAVADWVLDKAAARTAADYELVDLADYPLPHLDEAHAALDGPVRRRAHQGVGGEDRRIRRIHLRHARVQPLDLRRAEERDRLPVRRVEQQGRRVRQLRRARRCPGHRAPAGDRRASCRSRTSASSCASRCSPTSRTSRCSRPAPSTTTRRSFCSTSSSPGHRR